MREAFDTFDTGDVAYHLGRTVMDQGIRMVFQIFAEERRRRELINQAEIVQLRARVSCLLEERKQVQEFVENTHPGDLVSLRRRRLAYLCAAGILGVAGVALARLTLKPFGLGWETWGLCFAIGIVCPFAIHMMLDNLDRKKLIQAMCITAFLTGLAGVVIMAVLRGDLLLLYLRTQLSTGPSDNGSLVSTTLAEGFYLGALWKLRLFFGFLAVASELASGLAVHEAFAFNLAHQEAIEKAGQRRSVIEQELGAIAGRITSLENDGLIVEAQLKRDFFLGLLDAADGWRDSLMRGPRW